MRFESYYHEARMYCQGSAIFYSSTCVSRNEGSEEDELIAVMSQATRELLEIQTLQERMILMNSFACSNKLYAQITSNHENLSK